MEQKMISVKEKLKKMNTILYNKKPKPKPKQKP